MSPLHTLNTETTPFDPSEVTACLISFCIDGWKSQFTLSGLTTSSCKFHFFTMCPIPQVVTGHCYEFQVCAGVVVSGRGASKQARERASLQLGRGSSVKSHQHFSHTTAFPAGIPGAETLSDLKYLPQATCTAVCIIPASLYILSASHSVWQVSALSVPRQRQK